jgi:dTDP-4-amino-4,6-dideoxygalactose transaminase
MVVTKNKAVADRVRALRMYGENKRYETKEVSGVSRLDELQAAILRVKLHHLRAWNDRRRAIALLYSTLLVGIPNLSILPYTKGSCHHLFVIQTKIRDELRDYLKQQGIGTAVHYPVPLHLTKPGIALGYHRGDFPMAEKLSREVLSLPIYPELTNTNIVRISKAIKRFFLY